MALKTLRNFNIFFCKPTKLWFYKNENAHFWCKMEATNFVAKIVQGEVEQVLKKKETLTKRKWNKRWKKSPDCLRDPSIGRMILRGGIGHRKSALRVCVLATQVVGDTGRLRKLVRHARKSVCGVCVLAGFWTVAINAGSMNCGVVWTKATSEL